MVERVGLPPTMLWVVNNPIDQVFEEQALAFPLDRAGPRILSLGTMGLDKGVHELVEACGILHRAGVEFYLDLVGPERNPGVRSKVKQGLRREACEELVSLKEGVFGEDKLDLFREASIFVLPSYYENFPLVVLEASAAGQAIITTPVGAVPEFLQDGISALFVAPGNPRQLADAIMRLMNNPVERNCLAAAARQVFKSKLGRAEIMASLAKVYSQVIQHPSSDDDESTYEARSAGDIPELRKSGASQIAARSRVEESKKPEKPLAISGDVV